MHQLYTFKLTGEELSPLEVYASVETQSVDDALRRIREALKPHAGALSITGPSEACGAIVSVRVDGVTAANIFAVDGIVMDPFRDSEHDHEPGGCQDYSDDAQALASAGWGTEEDYFFGSCE